MRSAPVLESIDVLEDGQFGLIPGYYASYEIITRKHILPALGHLQVGKLSPTTLNRFYRDLADGGASSRVVRYCPCPPSPGVKTGGEVATGNVQSGGPG